MPDSNSESNSSNVSSSSSFVRGIFLIIAVIFFIGGSIVCLIGVIQIARAISMPGLQPEMTDSANVMIIVGIIITPMGKIFLWASTRSERKAKEKEREEVDK
jgi:hypothetical protein